METKIFKGVGQRNAIYKSKVMNFTVISDDKFQELLDKVSFLTEKVKHHEVEEILTISETAKLLKMSVKTLKIYTDKGKIIRRCVGDEIRYKKSEILESLKITNYAKINH